MANRIEKIKLNNVEYVISTDNIIDIHSGLTNTIAAEVRTHPGRLLRGFVDYPEYIFAPNYYENGMPVYYTAVPGDEKRIITFCVDWDELSITGVWVSPITDPVEIVDLTEL